MRITWKDGVTTLSTAGAIVLERAYNLSYGWPLVSSVRWAIIGIAALIAVSYVFSYILDSKHSTIWTVTAGSLALIATALTGFGLVFAAAEYVVLLMATAVVLWVASLVAHVTVPNKTTHGHTFA